jgi:hypothetical protein
MRAQRISSHLPDWSSVAVAATLLLAPWLFGYSDSMATLATCFSALILLLVSAIAIAEIDEDEGPEYFIVGAWLLISPWVLGFWSDTSALLTHALFGVAIVASVAWAIWGRPRADSLVQAKRDS